MIPTSPSTVLTEIPKPPKFGGLGIFVLKCWAPVLRQQGFRARASSDEILYTTFV